MRLPVFPDLSTKDGVTDENARMTNCLKESRQIGDLATIRPGLVLNSTYQGLGNGLIPFDGRLLLVSDDTIYDTEFVDYWWPLDSAPWSASTTYGINDSVWYGGDLWFSWAGGNLGNTPVAGSAYWGRSRTLNTYNAATTYDIGDEVLVDGVTYYSYSASNTGNTPSGSSNLWKTTPPGTARYYGSGGGYDAAPIDGVGPSCASKEAALDAWYAERTARSCASSSANTGWQWLALPYGMVGSPGVGTYVVVRFTAWVNLTPRDCTSTFNAGLIDACELWRTA